MYIYYYYNQELLLYIGSTNNIKQRQAQHKNSLKNGVKGCFYDYARENHLEYEELRCEVFDTDLTDINLLKIEEGNLIQELKPLCNKYIAGRTRKESNKEWCINNPEYNKDYYIDNREDIAEYQKNYRINNKEKTKEYNKAYYLKKKQDEELDIIVKDLVENAIQDALKELMA